MKIVNGGKYIVYRFYQRKKVQVGNDQEKAQSVKRFPLQKPVGKIVIIYKVMKYREIFIKCNIY